MELIQDDVKYNFKSISQFNDQLNLLQEQLPHILDDFEKYYVFYNMNPSNNEYQHMFENIKSNLNSINSKTFMVSNEVESEINNINQKLISLNSLIETEKETNKYLKEKLAIVKQEKNSADIRITNYKQIYDIGYLKNWALFLTIIVAGYSIYKVSTNKMQISTMQLPKMQLPKIQSPLSRKY